MIVQIIWKMRTVLVSFILRLIGVETVKITAYYPESADIKLLLSWVNGAFG